MYSVPLWGKIVKYNERGLRTQDYLTINAKSYHEDSVVTIQWRCMYSTQTALNGIHGEELGRILVSSANTLTVVFNDTPHIYKG